MTSYKDILPTVSFNYGNNNYNFAKDLGETIHIKKIYNTFINQVILLEGDNVNFIVKIFDDIPEQIFNKIKIINSVLAKENLTPLIIHSEKIYKDSKSQYLIITKHIKNNIIDKKNINTDQIKDYAIILNDLHNIDINKHPTLHEVLPKQRSIKDIVLEEATILDFKKTDINNLEHSIDMFIKQQNTNENSHHICHFDPIISNFIINKEDKFIIDLEYTSLCNQCGITWDLTYFIINNKLSDNQKELFIKFYIDSNNVNKNNYANGINNITNQINQLIPVIISYTKLWYKKLLETAPDHFLSDEIRKEIAMLSMY